MTKLLTLLALHSQTAQATSWRIYCEALHWACEGDIGENFVARLANQAMAVMNTLIGAAAVVGIMWGAALIASSGVNEEGRTKGRQIIITTLIGTALAILATNILGFVIIMFSGL